MKPQTATIWNQKPGPDEYAPWQEGYINAVPAGDFIDILGRQTGVLASLLAGLDASRWNYRYASGKWSVVELLGHVIDAERISAFRAQHIARGDVNPLPAWDQDLYMPESRFEEFANGPALLDQFSYLRAANLAMLKTFPPDTILRRGRVSTGQLSVRAAAWVMAGHLQHHIEILRDRYLGNK